jgi:hypothetical protein
MRRSRVLRSHWHRAGQRREVLHFILESAIQSVEYDLIGVLLCETPFCKFDRHATSVSQSQTTNKLRWISYFNRVGFHAITIWERKKEMSP